MSKHEKKESYQSSGKHKIAKITTKIRRLRMKVNRWKRYQDEIQNNKRSGTAKRWDTAGLEKHITLLESLL